MGKKKRKSGELPFEVCLICRKELPEHRTGRYRKTCSDKCRQAWWRQRQGRQTREVKRGRREMARRRALPLVEHRLLVSEVKPVASLGYRRGLYECIVCGKTYLVERWRSTLKVSPFCSETCRKRAVYHFDKFENARERAHQRGELDRRVQDRMQWGKLSPLCPQCGKPFAPNTNWKGFNKRGRPRKYCSDQCRWAAYEKRWKQTHRRARVHRWRECAECGVMFDRTSKSGQRTMRFCGETCSKTYRMRVYRIRQRVMREHQREGKWIKAWERGSSGHGEAARKARRNRVERENKENGERREGENIRYTG